VEDVSRAALAAVEAPRDAVYNEAFNIGVTDENYQVRDIAEIVADAVPGSRIRYADGGGADPRSYRVDFSKASAQLPGFQTRWTVADGVRELLDVFRTYDLSQADMESARFTRLSRIRALQGSGRLTSDLRWFTFDGDAPSNAARRRAEQAPVSP
jgi:hypothetical protein